MMFSDALAFGASILVTPRGSLVSPRCFRASDGPEWRDKCSVVLWGYVLPVCLSIRYAASLEITGDARPTHILFTPDASLRPHAGNGFKQRYFKF